MTVCAADDLQAVFDSLKPGDTLELEPGIYRAKTMLRVPDVTLRGAGADKTVLLWDDYATKLDEQGREYNTFRTWTVAVCADDVSMRCLSVVNDALSPREKGQEVALSVYGDHFYMEDCVLRSTQDTLFLGPLPKDLIQRYVDLLPGELRADRLLSQCFRRCRIEGSVDFIFGCGRALLADCELRSVFDGRYGGFVAAPAHAPEQKDGFTFRRCVFTAEDGVEAASIFLARPWRDYGRCRFEDCSYGEHIRPEGFDPWLDTGRDKTARFFECPLLPGRVPWAQTEA
jgi:pectinesterase